MDSLHSEQNLDLEYASIPEIDPYFLAAELTPVNGDRTRTLGLLKEMARRLIPKDDLAQMGHYEQFILFDELPDDMEVFHGGDLSYTGKSWSFDLNTALGFCESGYGGETRGHPTIRRITIGELKKTLHAIHQDRVQSGDRGKTMIEVFTDIVGRVDTTGSFTINIDQLSETGHFPKIIKNKPPKPKK